MKIHATYQHCAQIGPNEYEMQTKVFDMTPETPVADVIAWVRRVGRYTDKATDMHFQISVDLLPTLTGEDHG